MKKLFFSSNRPALAYLIVQKEAVQKYMGIPHETQLSLLIKPLVDIKILHTFSKHDFDPKPAVLPVFVEIENRSQPLLSAELYTSYRDFVVYGTTQWKASLKSSFKRVFTHEQFKRLSQSFGFSLDAAPLDLSLAQWIGLFEYYSAGVIDSKKMNVVGSYKRQESLQNSLKKVYRARR